MDGTLYELDGENKGFKNSSLSRAIFINAVEFVKKQEVCTEEEANRILQIASEDEIGISQYLSERYNITRNDYFNQVWNINPDGIIKNYESTSNFLSNRNNDKKRILLTSAPPVWAKQVLRFLGVEKYFQEVITGDQYGTKQEIFAMIAGRYKPENVLSVGDQLETDILPAQKYKFKTFQVTGPSDLERIID
jgi:FMN phosphatase YigB (HAD superfamily)